MRRFLFLWVLGLLACSSAPEYGYYPAVDARVYETGLDSTVVYPILPAGQGLVEVSAIGPVDVTAAHIRAMKVRMVIRNNTQSQTWTLSPKEQMLSIRNEGTTQAAYVDAGGRLENPAQLTISPGMKVTLDFYFALPEKFKNAGKIPKFAFQWNLITPLRSIARVTLFDRTPVPAKVAKVDPGSSWTSVV